MIYAQLNWVIQPSVVGSEVVRAGWKCDDMESLQRGVGVSEEVSEEAVVILA